MQRPLALGDAALRPDRAVELVLDLQQRRRELAIVVAVGEADRLVRRIRPRHGFLQRRAVAREAVEARGDRRLRVALVAEPPHAQRRRVRQVEGVAGQPRQLVRAALDEAGAHGGRRAEQVQEQPRVPAEVADQREVVGVRQRHGQREVVVDAGDRLHAPAVAVREAGPVDGLRAPQVGRAVATERDRVLLRQLARHAAAPQELVADRAVDRLVDLDELAHAGVAGRVHAGDELELRLREVRRDVRMGERGAERPRVRRGRERAVRPHAQAFLLDAAHEAGQRFAGQGVEAVDFGHRGSGGGVAVPRRGRKSIVARRSPPAAPRVCGSIILGGRTHPFRRPRVPMQRGRHRRCPPTRRAGGTR